MYCVTGIVFQRSVVNNQKKQGSSTKCLAVLHKQLGFNTAENLHFYQEEIPFFIIIMAIVEVTEMKPDC